MSGRNSLLPISRLLRSTFHLVAELAGGIVRSTQEEAHLRGWRLRQAGSIWRGVAVWRHLASASANILRCMLYCLSLMDLDSVLSLLH